jgi:transcriptional regulator with XRE-family HTH domain
MGIVRLPRLHEIRVTESAHTLLMPTGYVNNLVARGVGAYHWRVRIHDLFAKGVAQERRRQGLTQEQLANAFRSHGLRAWRTSTVGSLEAGLRRPKVEEMLMMARSLGVTVDKLLPGGDDERVELGDDAEVSPAWIRAMLASDIWHRPREEWLYERFPIDDIIAEVNRRADAERERAHEEQIVEWAEQQGKTLMAADLFASHKRPSDAERHAARRLGVEPSDVKLTSRALWGHRDFDEERDRRAGDVDQLASRSRQARRGLVTRIMLAELQAVFEEIGIGQRQSGAEQPPEAGRGERS